MIAKATHRALTRILKDKGDAREALQAFLEKHALKRKPESSYRKGKKLKALSRKGPRADVRAACAERSGGYCEHCSFHGRPSSPLEMDHFYGRAHAESEDTCWMLCRWCHQLKTENYPTRDHWDGNFSLFCEKYGFPFRPRLAKQLTRPSVEGSVTPHGTSTEEPVR